MGPVVWERSHWFLKAYYVHNTFLHFVRLLPISEFFILIIRVHFNDFMVTEVIYSYMPML